MKIIVDVYHPADVNFYKNAINIFEKRGIEVELTVRPRGELISILQKELPNVHFKIIGKYYSTISGKIFGYIKRVLELVHYLSKINFDIGTGFGSQICYASRFLGKPSVAFQDEYEYKLPFYLSKIAATCYVIPEYIPINGKNVYKYRGLKELAYLHPKYFKPNKKILERYELEPNGYVFIRKVANTSLNYRGVIPKFHKIISYLKERGFQIVLSLEDKSLINKYKENCIILEEPVDDIYSLLSFAALTISSGDTMARESCLVGTPTIYTGGRIMSVNKELLEKGCMFKRDNFPEIQNTINYIIENDLKKHVKNIIADNIKYRWDDITEKIVESIINVLNNDHNKMI